MTINGLCQVFIYGTHDPHLLYGVPGLGADAVFAFFSYKRYDLPVVCLAGIASAMFWYPLVYFIHGIYLYPVSFILADLAIRVLGSTVWNGLLGAALALIILNLARRRGLQPSSSEFQRSGDATNLANVTGLLMISCAVLLMVLTHGISSVSNFFLSIGPKIPSGNPLLEEYNPGYVIGILVIFLVVTMLVLLNLLPRYSGQAEAKSSSSEGASLKVRLQRGEEARRDQGHAATRQEPTLTQVIEGILSKPVQVDKVYGWGAVIS